MGIKEYQNKAYRTLKMLGSTELNLSHMVIGLASELGELQQAIDNRDFKNLNEEVGDVMWYIANYATLRNISIVIQHDLSVYNFKHLVTAVSELNDIVKKRIAYDKPIDLVAEAVAVQRIVNICTGLYESGWKCDIIDAMTKNINKLKARYPDKYSDEKALNRDLDAENKALS